MPNVFIACWTMNAAGLGSTTARTDMLRTVALTAETQLRMRARTVGGAFTPILVVPEYFFNANAQGADLLDRQDKHSIYNRLKDISRAVPDLVFIAGTIAYGKGIFSKDTYNVCPILWGGQIRAKLYKSDDDGAFQINGTFRTKTDGGKSTPIVVLPSGLTLGLDICMDFNHDRLGRYLQATGAARPDIHVQISGSNAAFKSKAQAGVNGVYVHCDLGGRGAAGASAWRVTSRDAVAGADVTGIPADQTMNPGAGTLVFFSTPV